MEPRASRRARGREGGLQPPGHQRAPGGAAARFFIVMECRRPGSGPTVICGPRYPSTLPRRLSTSSRDGGAGSHWRGVAGKDVRDSAGMLPGIPPEYCRNSARIPPGQPRAGREPARSLASAGGRLSQWGGGPIHESRGGSVRLSPRRLGKGPREPR